MTDASPRARESCSTGSVCRRADRCRPVWSPRPWVSLTEPSVSVSAVATVPPNPPKSRATESTQSPAAKRLRVYRLSCSPAARRESPHVLVFPAIIVSLCSPQCLDSERRAGSAAQPRPGSRGADRACDRVDQRAVQLPALPEQRHIEVHIGYPDERAVRQVRGGQSLSGTCPIPARPEPRTRSPLRSAHNGPVCTTSRRNALRINMSCSASSRFHASDGAEATASAVNPSGR